MSDPDPGADAVRALACLDLTDLSEDCDAEAVRALAARAVTPWGTVAALCVWPRFVELAREAAPPDVRVCTVASFPTGAGSDEDAVEQTEAALRAGADEIDVVIPYRELMEGNPAAIRARVERIKRAADSAPVKAILETGVLDGAEMTREAADLALEGGADFLKTSTGKAPVGATLSAAQILLEAIRDCGRPAGLKVSGGVRTASEAASYLALADDVMGEGWARPSTFRIGASSLLDDLLAALQGAPARDGAA